MRTPQYQTDRTEAEFEQIKSCLQVERSSKWPLIMILNAIFYVCGEGIKWRSLPADFGLPWQTVYWYFAKWSRNGCWQGANEHLVMLRRQSSGASPLPHTLVIDSQSVKNSPTATATVGVDGGKKIKGRKRLELSDGAGNLLMVKVFAANHHDGPAAYKWWEACLAMQPMLCEVTRIRADHHFGGVFKKGIESGSEIRVEISAELVDKPAQKAMPVHKGRWVIERTLACNINCRRLARDYERLPRNSEAFLIIGSIARLLKHRPCPI